MARRIRRHISYSHYRAATRFRTAGSDPMVFEAVCQVALPPSHSRRMGALHGNPVTSTSPTPRSLQLIDDIGLEGVSSPRPATKQHYRQMVKVVGVGFAVDPGYLSVVFAGCRAEELLDVATVRRCVLR